MPFSKEATEELRLMYEDINKMMDCSVNALSTNKVEEAKNVFNQECQINAMRDKLKSNHVRRLEQGACNVISGVIFLDTISNLEKIGDHLNNVAQAVIEGLQ
jgi:phosphate:Na+ symporter